MSPATSDQFLATITSTIVDRFAPERIVLFGSRARGDHQPESDYDLIVVLETSLPRGERDRPFRDVLCGADRHVDVIVYTPAEFERSRHDVGALAYAGEAEGRVLYDRIPSRWPRRVREESGTAPESLTLWLARAENDFAATSALWAASEAPDVICFHAHQGVEKLLKAGLIRNHIPPPRTHNLSELLGRSVAVLRDDPRAVCACEILDRLWPKMRYPDHLAPTRDEAASAMAAAKDVRLAVLRYLDRL
jgi:HEPN domain-containing protein/predicted nucleotidyltransferase